MPSKAFSSTNRAGVCFFHLLLHYLILLYIGTGTVYAYRMYAVIGVLTLTKTTP